jgi:hypothetical protein
LLLLVNQGFIQLMDDIILKRQLHFQLGKPIITHAFYTLEPLGNVA